MIRLIHVEIIRKGKKQMIETVSQVSNIGQEIFLGFRVFGAFLPWQGVVTTLIALTGLSGFIYSEYN